MARDKDLDDFVDMFVVERRETLMKLQPRCPRCGDAQVQLVVWSTVPAQWCCRICKFRFDQG